MEKLRAYLTLDQRAFSRTSYALLMLVAYIFAIAIRYIWIDWASGFPEFFWNGQLMINTNDGYYWAEGARDILAGKHQLHDLSPVNYPLAYLTAFLASVLPVKFETLILWMPAFFGALLVVPIMLTARLLKMDLVGFVAALAGSITWSYYNRTMAGYYDTDMLIVVLPAMTIWGAMYALKNPKIANLLYAPLFAIVSTYWHNGTINIINGLFIIFVVYTLLFERKNRYAYKFLSLYVLALTTIPVWLKIALVLLFVALFYFLKERLRDHYVMIVAAVSVLIYLIFGGSEWMMNILHNAYFTRGSVLNETNATEGLKFYGVVNTVREAGHIPFEIFADRISGNLFLFWTGVVGYLLLLLKDRVMLLTLPMVGLGFFALQGGLRFTVFAIPFIALGTVYLLFLLAKYIASFADEKSREWIEKVLLLAVAVLVLYPNVKHVIAYKVPVVFTKPEVDVLNQLKGIANREDYVVAWWDYGYPLRYYSDVKTLIDGGKHTGQDNFPVSYVLTHDQVSAANMARLDVELTEKSFDTNSSPVEMMLKRFQIENPDDFLKKLQSKSLPLPPKSRDVYLYLPNRMIGIFPTIDLFSNIDLRTGAQRSSPFFYVAQKAVDRNGMVDFGNGVILDKTKGVIQLGNQIIPIQNFVTTAYDKQGKLHTQVQKLHEDGYISIIFMQNYGQFLIMDRNLYNSLYIQLFVLENYDKDLYEPVILSPVAKVYKLKR